MTMANTDVLLATDLGFRCDRATDRALRLARQSDGRAIAVTAVESAKVRAQDMPRPEPPSWFHDTSPLLAAERALHREVDGQPPGAWQVQVGEGDAGTFVLAALARLRDDALVVTGPVREGVLGPTVLGSTVDALLRRPATSLLMARSRVHGDYRHALVASDWSASSRIALQRVQALLPGIQLTVLHGFTVPMLGLMNSTQPQALAQAAAQARTEGRAFLREAGLGDDVRLVVEHGDPARLAQQFVASEGADLVVLGTHGRGAMYELVVGSVARRILATVGVDALVVRG